MPGYSTNRATIPTRTLDSRAIITLYIPGVIKPHWGSVSGLRTAAPASEIRVFDSITHELKRILSPDGKKIIKEFAK